MADYNFWQDEVHVRGVWRRCTLAEYKKEVPAWEVVLDLDALSKAEGKTWVWAGSIVLDEGPDTPTDRVLIKLSDGGADATHVRELDINTKQFIPASDKGALARVGGNSRCCCRCESPPVIAIRRR